MRTSFEIVAVELFVGRWILFRLRQRMAISSAIAVSRMSAVQVCARGGNLSNDHLRDFMDYQHIRISVNAHHLVTFD